jgi:hypothetical protein
MARGSRVVVGRVAGGGFLAASLAIAVVDVQAVGADPFGAVPPGSSSDTGSYPDSNPHRSCFGAWPSSEGWWALQSLATTDANSDMDSVLESCNWSGSDWTDIHAQVFDLPAGVRGATSCTATHGSSTCDRNDVLIDLGEIAYQGNDYEGNVRKTVCHEFGHSMGLTHYKVNAYPYAPEGQHDCMISGVVNYNNTWFVYSAHHKSHINSVF